MKQKILKWLKKHTFFRKYIIVCKDNSYDKGIGSLNEDIDIILPLYDPNLIEELPFDVLNDEEFEHH